MFWPLISRFRMNALEGVRKFREHNRFGKAGNWHRENIFIYDELKQSDEKNFQSLILKLDFSSTAKQYFRLEDDWN